MCFATYIEVAQQILGVQEYVFRAIPGLLSSAWAAEETRIKASIASVQEAMKGKKIAEVKGMISGSVDSWDTKKIQEAFRDEHVVDEVQRLRTAMQKMLERHAWWETSAPSWQTILQNCGEDRTILGTLANKGDKGLKSSFPPDEPTLSAAGQTIADFTCAQAITNTLDPGQTRASLCREIKKSLMKRPWHNISQHVIDGMPCT